MKKKWTVMVYLAGDNDLSEDMIWSLIGMRNVMTREGSDKHVNLVAIYDSGYPTVPIQTYSFTNQNSRSKLGDIAAPDKPNDGYKGRNGHRESRDTAYIIDFVNSSVREFKADHYALIMSGHSDGILGKTMFYDSNPNSQIMLPYLGNILRVARKCIGENKEEFNTESPKFDLIGFDSCMMGMLEVSYELRDVAKYMVASQGYSPTDGWNYEAILKDLIENNGNLTPEEFANSIVNNQISYSYDYNAGGRSMCLSSVDLEKAFDLRKSINKLGKSLNDVLIEPISIESNPVDQEKAIVRESIKNVIHNSHYVSQTYLHEQAVDVLDFVRNLSANCDLKLKELEIFAQTPQTDKSSSVGNLKRKLKGIKLNCNEIMVQMNFYIKNKRMSGPEYQFSEGISVFFPWTLLAYNMVYHSYNDLRFSKHSNWVRFIETYVNQTLRSKNKPQFGDSGNTIYGDWIFNVDQSNKAETARAETARAETAKAETAKGDNNSFYKYFRRFRNHPVYHDVEKR